MRLIERFSDEGYPAGECVFCRHDVWDDGVLLLTPASGEWCPTKVGLGARHRHCNGFIPDGSGEDTRVCASCLVLASDHPKRL